MMSFEDILNSTDAVTILEKALDSFKMSSPGDNQYNFRSEIGEISITILRDTTSNVSLSINNIHINDRLKGVGTKIITRLINDFEDSGRHVKIFLTDTSGGYWEHIKSKFPSVTWIDV